MKPKRILTLILFLIPAAFILSCFSAPTRIPTGKWEYKIIINEIELGSAAISNEKKNDVYVSTTEMTLKVANNTQESKKIITETLDFKPVKLESINKIISDKFTHTTEIIANFNGREVSLSRGKVKSTINIDKDFYLEGNYVTSKLIESGYKKDKEVLFYLYDPAIGLDEAIPIKTVVSGVENVLVEKRELKLMHIVQFLGEMKLADIYINEEGVLIKGIINMMNIKLELIKK